MAEKKVTVLDVGAAIADAGISGVHAKQLGDKLGIAAPTMTRYLQQLVESGWASKSPNGAYVVGAIVDVSNRRRAEDIAALVADQQAMLELIHPQPPPGGGHTDGQMFLGLRYIEEMRAEMKAYHETVRRLLEEREGQGEPIERIG